MPGMEQRRWVRVVSALGAAIAALALGTSSARAGTTVAEIARIKGQGRSTLQGIGLVVGLPGTGDSGKDLVLARPVAEVLRKNGIPVASFDELKNSKSAALVAIECDIPEEGARVDDTFDIRVSTYLGASGLKGGRLLMAALRGPYPELDPQPYAIARGAIEIDDRESPTTGRIRGGASMIRDVVTGRSEGGTLTLVLLPHYAGYPSATQVAQTIHQEIMGRASSAASIATAIDDRTIRVEVPEDQRVDRANFVADVMKVSVDVALMRLPAQVICDTKRGAIVITGDVEVSPAVLTQKELTITSTTPEPAPTPNQPRTTTEKFTRVGTNLSDRQRVKLTDLLNAFNQLNIPVIEQINLLQMLRESGSLHAKLIID